MTVPSRVLTVVVGAILTSAAGQSHPVLAQAAPPAQAPAQAQATSPSAAALTPQPPAMAEEPATILIPMELLANRPLVRATINGEGPFAFLIVPGARRTVIDPELGELLKIKRAANGAQEAAVELTFAPKHTVKATIAVEDLMGYVAEYPAPVRPRGVISLSLWSGQLVTLDYPRWKLSIEPGTLDEPDGKTVFALTPSLELRLPLVVAEQSVECHVDPMFPSDLVIPASLLAGDAPRLMREVGVVRTSTGVRRVREVKLPSAMLGPFELKAPVMLVTEGAGTARIGASWLGRFEVTYDLATERIRIGRPSPIMARQ